MTAAEIVAGLVALVATAVIIAADVAARTLSTAWHDRRRTGTGHTWRGDLGD